MSAGEPQATSAVLLWGVIAIRRGLRPTWIGFLAVAVAVLKAGRGWRRGHPRLRRRSASPQGHFVVTFATLNPATPLPFTLCPLSPVNVYSRCPW